MSQTIRRNIQNAKYDKLDQVIDDLNKIKQNYVTDGLAPVFPGYEVLIAEAM